MARYDSEKRHIRDVLERRRKYHLGLVGKRINEAYNIGDINKIAQVEEEAKRFAQGKLENLANTRKTKKPTNKNEINLNRIKYLDWERFKQLKKQGISDEEIKQRFPDDMSIRGFIGAYNRYGKD